MNKKKPDIKDFDFLGGNQFDSILNEARYILFYDEVSSESAKELNTKLLGMSLETPKKPIYLEICSVGGEVGAGISIINTILHIPSPVVTIINGEALSMAGFISIAGDDRYMTPNSFWMAHAGESGIIGSPYAIKDRADYLMRLEEHLIQIFKDKTKLTEVEFEKIVRGELWFDANQCLEKGIVNNIYKLPTRTITRKSKKAKK